MSKVTIPKIRNEQYSLKAAHDVQAQPKECWDNAILTILYSDWLEATEAEYVEGWVYLPGLGGLVVEHGWVEARKLQLDQSEPEVDHADSALYTHAEAQVIDPTYAVQEPQPAFYFAGYRLSKPELIKLYSKEETLPLVRLYGRGGFNNPDFKAAYTAAMSYRQEHEHEQEAAD